MCNLWGNSSCSLKTDTVLKTKSFFSRGSFRVDYDPPEGRVPLSSHAYTWPTPQHSPCFQKVCWRRAILPTQELMVSNQKLKNQRCFSNLPPTSRLPKAKQTRQTNRKVGCGFMRRARGWQLELRFQRRLTKAAAGAGERLSQALSVLRGGDARPEPWNTATWLPNLLPFDRPLISEYIDLSQNFPNQIPTIQNWYSEHNCICFLLRYLVILLVSPSLIFWYI